MDVYIHMYEHLNNKKKQISFMFLVLNATVSFQTIDLT